MMVPGSRYSKLQRRILDRFNYVFKTNVTKFIKAQKLWFQENDKIFYKFDWDIKDYKRVHKERVYPRITTNVELPYLDKLKTLDKFFFFYMLKYYNKYFSFFSPQPNLLATWMRLRFNRLRKTYPRKAYQLTEKHFISLNKRPPFVHRIRFINARKLIASYHVAYFCFSSFKKLKNMLRKYEYSFVKKKISLGLHGAVISQLFRTNIFPTTKYCYALIKMGALCVNGRTCTNPYKILVVGDSFSINKKFIKKCSKLLRYRLRKDFILVNIPNYIDYCYKTFHFLIWRQPLPRELYFTYFYPFANKQMYIPSSARLSYLRQITSRIPGYL